MSTQSDPHVMSDAPAELDLPTILVIGSGPIVIGQAAEFDYAGTQACQSLREEGYRVVLVNSNPATIMTDLDIADTVYIEPLTPEVIERVIEKERPFGLLATLGGQTALNLAVELAEAGILERYGVQLLGTTLASIQQAEDRRLFKDLMISLGQPIPRSKVVESMEAGIDFIAKMGLPAILRPAYTLGGTGGGIANTAADFEAILSRGLTQSPIGQVLIEKSIGGWKEIEYEVLRDADDTCIIVCNMENIDPVGVHTGDSIVVAPSLTLTDREHQMLRTAACDIIRALKIEGGCNVQFALHPDGHDYCVIEVNPRVSRSSALASKATGYPIAKVAAKIAVGKRLDEILNPVTGKTYASFEPALDYVVVKMPRWPFDKFPMADRSLGTQMKATGEVMSLERTFEAALLKAIRSLEVGLDSLHDPLLDAASNTEIDSMLRQPDDRRLWAIAKAFRTGWTVQDAAAVTGIDPFFLKKVAGIIAWELELQQGGESCLTEEVLKQSKKMGLSDRRIAELIGVGEEEVLHHRHTWGIRPAYLLVDTCAAEFESATPYYYSTYHSSDEVSVSDRPKALVLGSGPIRIGQGIEFDYCSVHAVWALKRLGYETLIINNNPETVSTDFDVADRLYFEPLTAEDVLEIIHKEKVELVFVQYGGQTAINLAAKLQAAGVKITGTPLAAIDCAEDRERFRQFLLEREIPQSNGGAVWTIDQALQVAIQVGYPVIVRPSYVIGGRAMAVVRDAEALQAYMQQAIHVSPEHPILIDQYLSGVEVEVDAVCDGENVFIPGIFEHIERAGVHSGDSMSVYPPQTLSKSEIDTIVTYTTAIATGLPVVGLVNIQFVIYEGQVYVLEVNPRASRTVPIISKVTGVPLVELSIQVQTGQKLATLGWGTGLLQNRPLVAVKAPMFSFQKMSGLDIHLSPEMKSTGEVLGIGNDFATALQQAFSGVGIPLAPRGVLCSISEHEQEEASFLLGEIAQTGCHIYATPGTAQTLLQKAVPAKVVGRSQAELESLLRSGAISLVINTPTNGQDPTSYGFHLRRACVEFKVPCMTSLDTVRAYVNAIKGTNVQELSPLKKVEVPVVNR